ncbi:GNAT family N-acetyltransferase [Roseovarius sp. M141]|uniref:GNAT family N-acetyltransferase n=1 Tax=Roseovarius sp. M141 TaxID=2583806 RepID=UPI0020CB8193|nr:GNAT family N-acetyltransferase [Roseovarius sp. M141]
MPIEINELETRRFGITAAKVTELKADIKKINAAAQTDRVQLLTIRVSTDDLARVQELEADGYRLMDTLVYYDRMLADAPTPQDALIRLATPADAEAVATVARASFAGYFGHYHADPRLSDASADAAYVEWAENSIKGCGPKAPACVAERADRILGFMTMRMNSDTEAEIILNGVHPSAQGEGIYGRILASSMALLKVAGRTRVVTSTQVNNITVQRAWGRQGLRMARSYYTLHKWFNNSRAGCGLSDLGLN